MSDLTQEAADRIVASWRGSGPAVAEWDSPAGPVFAAGEFAESDITMEAIFAASGCPNPTPGTNLCGTACTYSAGRQCC
ncbi:hypothetical protein GCM10009557_70640 [Virgisporangium ochraceum]|jgi:hypothetical protein|nr:DUF6229 family protein [Virgisporangium ochraceum]